MRGVVGGRPSRLVLRKETSVHPSLQGYLFLYCIIMPLSIVITPLAQVLG